MTKNYQTVSEAVNDLIKRGYVTNFSINAEKECLMSDHDSVCLAPEEFAIDEVYRFEGITDPADEAVVYALSSSQHTLKGVVVDAFGTYSDSKTAEVMDRLHKRLS